MTKVKDVMETITLSCLLYESLNRAAQLMWDFACSGLPVVDQDQHPIGFITDRDICMAAYTQGKLLTEMPVELAMARRVIFCKADDTVEHALKLMRSAGVRRLPVVDEQNKLVGMLCRDQIENTGLHFGSSHKEASGKPNRPLKTKS